MEKFLPIIGWLRTYPKAWLSNDVVAGLTTSAVIIPKAMAFAAIAGLLIVRTEGRMTFASAPRVGGRLWELIHEARPSVLVVDFSAIPDIEYTALKMLTEAEEKLHDGGITLWLAALNPELLKVIERSPLGQTLGHERIFFNLEQVVEAFRKQSK